MNLGPVAFWIFLAVVVFSSGWFRSRSEAARHETLRRIVEKTGQADESQMRALFHPQPAHNWGSHEPWQSKTGNGYRAMRILGTLILFVAAGLFICFAILGQAGEQNDVMHGYAVASVVTAIGLGLLFSSRFLPRPPDLEPKDQKPS